MPIHAVTGWRKWLLGPVEESPRPGSKPASAGRIMASGGTFRREMQGVCVDKSAANRNGFLGPGRCEAFEHLARWHGS